MEPSKDAQVAGLTPYQQRQLMADDEIDLRELWGIIWDGKWLILALTLVSGGGAAIYAKWQPNIYRAESLLAPAAGGGAQSAAARLASQFGGLASLAGVDVGGGGGDQTTIALAVLQSRAFLQEFIARHELLIPLMAAKAWDSERGAWVIDPAIYDEKGQRWVREVKPGRSPEPSEWEAYKALSELLSVEQDKKSNLVTVAIESQSPEVAQQWVSWLVAELNGYMRQRDEAAAERTIAYLEEQITKTSLTDMQAIFFNLIEEENRRLMLTRVREEYSLATIDPAVVPEEKVKPKRALIAAVGVMLGGMLGVFWVFVRRAIKGAGRPHEGKPDFHAA